ncbi:MAG: AAA family ATPase [Flavobacteriales bacterium]|nr:AAA family ATPase [Flavobacteriales bacterium]
MSNIVGRIEEQNILRQAFENDKSELIALYGRRRIGKTFLIREFFKKSIVFEVTGLYNGNMKDQFENYIKEVKKRTKNSDIELPNSWLDAFTLLEEYLDSLKGSNKKVVFIDEFPWIATAKSKFLMAFENFWNTYCTKRQDIIVVICGSAASYMVQKIIKNKGGLHNRITRKIRLLSFNLHETELFLKKNSIKYTRYDIIQIYMTLGGVPHYLEKLSKGKSVPQNIDSLCFSKDGLLNDEFNQLYVSLFDDSERHMKIIRTLAGTNKGLTRNELIEKSGISSGGDFTLKLDELVESGFVTEYPYYQNKNQLTLYRLSDEYSKFYLKFIDNNKDGGEGTWQRLSTTPSYNSWSGFVFETLCLKHIYQIKKSLRIDAIYSTNSSWFNDNAQVDLLIDRDDNVMNLCEIKFYNAPYTIDKKYYLNLKNKVAELQKDTNTKKNIFITMVTTYGVNDNEYSKELVQNNLDMDALFIE